MCSNDKYVRQSHITKMCSWKKGQLKLGSNVKFQLKSLKDLHGNIDLIMIYYCR